MCPTICGKHLLPLPLQVSVWLSLAREVRGGPRVEPDCEEINQAASFGVSILDTHSVLGSPPPHTRDIKIHSEFINS